MSQKRSRSINWDEEEKQLFRSVLKEYAPIIENKTLNTNTNKSKNKAWEEVHKKFNELNGRPRELGQLKLQWKTMKVNARKTMGTYKRETNKTGGGARPHTPTDEAVEVTDLLNPAELLIDHNIYDSDSIILSPLAKGEVASESTIETCVFTLQDTCVETTEDTDKQGDDVKDLAVSEICQDDTIMATPRKICIGPVSSPANMSNKKRKKTETGSKFRKDHNDYANSIINHSKILKEKEFKRRMEMAEEEHAVKMEILKEKLKCAVLEREFLENKKISAGNE